MRFLFVDEILDLVPGKTIRAAKHVDAGEDFFRDHFPGFPVVPGVLLTEMMAQAAGKCLDAEGTHPGKAMLARINSASFRQWVGPDQRAVICADIRTNRDDFATAECSVEVGGKKVCQAELLFMFVPFEKFAPQYRDEVLERYLSGTRAAEAP